jgi:hypothetical protein
MEHWEAYRQDSVSGREQMRLAREQLKNRSTDGPVVVPTAPLSLPPLPAGLLSQAIPQSAVSAGLQAIRVPCPHCGAAVGAQCFIPSRPDRRPAGGSHPSRRVAGLGGTPK